MPRSIPKLIPALSPACAAASVTLFNHSYYTGMATAPCVKPSAQRWADEEGLRRKLQLRRLPEDTPPGGLHLHCKVGLVSAAPGARWG